MRNAFVTMLVVTAYLWSQSFNSFAAEGQPQVAQAGSGNGCELFIRIADIRSSSKKLVDETAALGAINPGTKVLSAPWVTQLLGEARAVSKNAEELASAPAKADPEALFYLGKHMNQYNQMVSDSSFQSARARNAGVDSLAKRSEGLIKDVAFVLERAAQLKDQAARCAQTARGA